MSKAVVIGVGVCRIGFDDLRNRKKIVRRQGWAHRPLSRLKVSAAIPSLSGPAPVLIAVETSRRSFTFYFHQSDKTPYMYKQ
jgi:hypothetical protein